MNAVEIELRISLLSREVENLHNMKRNAKRKQEDIEKILVGLNRKRNEIETKLAETIRVIERRLNKINPNSKFKGVYLRNAKSKVYNGSSQSALDAIEKAKRKARKQYQILDDDIEDYSRRIQMKEREIQNLKEALIKVVDK